MGLYSMRTEKDSVLFRLASAAHNYGVTPNVLTAVGLCFGVASGVLFMFHATPLAFAAGFLSVFCDLLDGTLARKFHLETKGGLFFDSTADRISETAVVVGALTGGIIDPLGSLAIVGSILLFGLRMVSYRSKLNTDYVMFGRFERLACILVGLSIPFTPASTLCFVAAGVFALISSGQIVASLWQHRHRKKPKANFGY
jgi:CDP-diacylglycerol--glycerol-3-phosphate 3-phosphatidyltransferase